MCREPIGLRVLYVFDDKIPEEEVNFIATLENPIDLKENVHRKIIESLSLSHITMVAVGDFHKYDVPCDVIIARSGNDWDGKNVVNVINEIRSYNKFPSIPYLVIPESGISPDELREFFLQVAPLNKFSLVS